MALGVNLRGIASDGTVVWSWLARYWNGGVALDLVAPPPADIPESWCGPITPEQIETLREKAGGRLAEAEFRERQRTFGVKPDADLDELLAMPLDHVDLYVEEWCYG